MKKLLGATLAIVMGATLVGALAACNTNDDAKDAETAKKAIGTVRALYLDKAKDTPANYTVIGKTRANDVTCTINWTVNPAATCTIENFSKYVSVGEINPDDNLVTISISRTEAVIDYTLKASVTVGNATESVEFARSVPEGKDITDLQTTDAQLLFNDKANRTSQDANSQVWEQNGIKFTNAKASSSTDVADYADPVRIYKGSSIKLEYPGMVQIVFTSADKYGTEAKDDYPANLQACLQAAKWASNATVTVDGSAVTVDLEVAVDVLEFDISAGAGQVRLKEINLKGVVGGATDEDKVAVGKLTLDLDTKNYTATGTYDLPATVSGANVSWAVKGTSDNVSIDGGKLKVNSMPAADTEVTLTATISSGSVTDTKDITIKLVVVSGLVNDGTLEHPYTPTEAKLVAKQTLAIGATAETEVYVKGYVIAPGTYSTQFKNFDNMYIADVYAADKATTADDALYVYRPKPDGTYLTTEGFTKGDLVTFRGKLQNYKGTTMELTSATCVAREVAQRTDADVVADAKAAVDLTKKHFVTANEEVTLPATMSGATLSWAVQGTTDVVEIAGGKLTIKSLPATEASITLVVTISSGEVTDTKDIVITVVAPKPFEVGTYKLALQQVTLGKKLYFAGTLSGNYGATTESVLQAADVEIAAVEGGYTLKVGEKYLELAVNGTSAKLALNATSTAAWVYDNELEVFTWTNISGKIYYLGTYNSFNTISASETKYISGANAGNVGVTQFVLGCEKFDYSALTEAEKVALVKDALALSETTFKATGTTALPTVNADGVTVTWASNNTELVTVSAENIEVIKLPDAETTVTLTATITCGGASDTKTFDITVKQAEVLWRVATAADIAAGKTIIFTYNGWTMDVHSSNGNFRTAVNKFDTSSESVVAITLEAASEGKFYLKVNDGYLCAPTAKSNYLHTKSTVQTDGSSEWTIEVGADGSATITPSNSASIENRTLMFNANSGQERFACYKSGQKNIVLYTSVDA